MVSVHDEAWAAQEVPPHARRGACHLSRSPTRAPCPQLNGSLAPQLSVYMSSVGELQRSRLSSSQCSTRAFARAEGWWPTAAEAGRAVAMEALRRGGCVP